MTFKKLRIRSKGTYCAGNWLKYQKEKVYGPATILEDEDDEEIPLEEDDYKGMDHE